MAEDAQANAKADEALAEEREERKRRNVLRTHRLSQNEATRHPDSYEAVLGLARSQYLMGEVRLEGDPTIWFTRAAQSFERAVELSKGRSAFAWLGRGNALYALGEYPDALLPYTKATQLSPKNAAAWSGLGNTLRRLGRFDEARGAQQKAYVLRPDNVEIASNYGLLLLEMARRAQHHGNRAATALYTEAQTVYDAALAADPNNVELWCGTGDALAGSGDYVRAAAQYEQATRLDPRNIKLLMKLAEARYESGDYQAALSGYEKVLQLDPTDLYALDGKGNALRHLGKWEEAEVALRRALARRPDDRTQANLWANLALVYEGWGKTAETADAQSQVDALVRKLKRQQ